MSVEAFERARDRLSDRSAAAVDADRELGSVVISAPVSEVLRLMASDLLEPDVLAHWLARLEIFVNEVGTCALEYLGVDVGALFDRARDDGDMDVMKALQGYFGTLHGVLGQQLLMGMLLSEELANEARARMDSLVERELERIWAREGMVEAMATPLELHRLVPAHESFAAAPERPAHGGYPGQAQS